MVDPSIYAGESRRLAEKLLNAVSRGIALTSRGKLTRLRYCLVVSIFNWLIGCALIDETPTDPLTTTPAAAQIKQPTVTSPRPAPPVVTEPPLIGSFREAVSAAADALFLQASRQVGFDTAAAPQSWIIDPLIDGVSGMQSNATRAIEVRAIEVARSKYPQFALQLIWMSQHCYCSAPSPPLIRQERLQGGAKLFGFVSFWRTSRPGRSLPRSPPGGIWTGSITGRLRIFATVPVG